MNMEDVEERTAVVTGGTRGIGRAIAERLMRDGMRCLVTGTSADGADRAPEGADYHAADLRDECDVATLAEKLKAVRPHVLVNNVGLNVKGETSTFPLDVFDDLQRVNLRAPFVFIQAVLPTMIKREWGRVVNVTSLWGVSANALDAAYCASKFGLDGLTAAVAAEVAPHNVLINAVAPGYIYTEAAAEAFTPEALEEVSQAIPLKRLGRPDEVAGLVSWLVGDDNTYMTGQNLLIDGGLTRTAKP